MSSSLSDKIGPAVLVSVIVAFFAGHLFGPSLFDNNWSFTHWKYLPAWYGYLWLVALALAMFAATRYATSLGSLFSKKRNVIIGLATLFVLSILFQFDSFVYGGGNLRVAQIAQAPVIIFRWFEFGSVFLVAVIFKLLSLFTAKELTAGVLAWRVAAFASTALSLVGAAKLVAELTTDATRRLFWFFILFFGPQALLYRGFVGIEPMVVALTIWFALIAVRLSRQFTARRLAILWVLTLGGVAMHFTMAYLVPAAVYLSLSTPFKKGRRPYAAFALALISYVALLYIVYTLADRSLEFSRFLLFPDGKAPHTDYGLASPRRVGDIFQIMFLAAPLAIVIKAIAFTTHRWMTDNHLAMTGWWMAVAGTTTLIILDPVNSVVMDFPRFIAYLTPFSFLYVVVLASAKTSGYSLRFTAAIAVTSLFLPLAYLPVHINIDRAAEYTDEYFDKHNVFHRTGGLAFRDAYFYNREFKKATFRESNLRITSPDYLNLSGCRDLAAAGQGKQAITILNRMIAKQPYWTEPRALVAALQLRQGQPQLAKPQIDTCLLLAPYRRDHHINLYSYYRHLGRLPEALSVVRRALEIFPGDKEILVDEMLLVYRTGKVAQADSLADRLISRDPSLPHPYWVKGNIEERRDSLQRAIDYYMEFLFLAPEDPEAPMVTNRLDQVRQRLREK